MYENDIFIYDKYTLSKYPLILEDIKEEENQKEIVEEVYNEELL